MSLLSKLAKPLSFFASLSLGQKTILFVGLIFYGLTLFPTTLVLDAQTMYQAALNLRYSDNLPPLTLFLWHCLSYLKPGGDLMLVINLFFLWGACFIGFYTFKGKKAANVFLVIPFIPPIYFEAGLILKDTIFSFGYMFMAMILAYHTLKNKSLTLTKSIFLLLGVGYFSMAKVQAQFIFPLMVIWIVSLRFSEKSKIYKVIVATGLSLITFGAMTACNNSLIQKQNNYHYWQYRDIYDLAGISVMSEKSYIPAFLFKDASKDLQSVKDHYDYLWEPLIASDNSPLRATQTDEERKILHETWLNSIFHEPVAYVKHRTRLWLKIMGGSILKGKYIEWVRDYPSLLSLAPLLSLFSFLPFFPVFLYFWWISAKNFSRRREAIPAFYLSSMGLILIFVLYFFSLAAAARYIYFSWCCFAFSIPFMWALKTKSPVALEPGK